MDFILKLLKIRNEINWKGFIFLSVIDLFLFYFLIPMIIDHLDVNFSGNRFKAASLFILAVCLFYGVRDYLREQRNKEV